MTNRIQVGDIGRKFRVTVADTGVAINISTATIKEIIFSKPDGTASTKTATFETDGSDGMIYWITTAATDLDLPGKWKIQAHIVLSGGANVKTEVENFQVYENLV